MFLGEYRHTVDSKGRVFIPARFREHENQRFFVNRGGKVTRLMNFGAFVDIGGSKEGMIHISKLAHERVEKVEDVVAVGDAVTVKVMEIDKQGRINLPGALLQKAGLSREVIVVGVSDHIEIWDTARWEEYQREAGTRYEEIAENLAE